MSPSIGALKITGKDLSNAESILKIDSDLIEETLEKVYPIVFGVYESLAEPHRDNRDAVAKGTEFLDKLRNDLSKKYPPDDAIPQSKRRRVRDVIKAGKVS